MGNWNVDDPNDSVVTAKISAKRINVLLFIFNVIFISLGLLGLLKDLNLPPNNNKLKLRGMWNGYTPAFCWVSEFGFEIKSLLKSHSFRGKGLSLRSFLFLDGLLLNLILN